MAREILITDEFLLQSKTASRLYHEHAENLPIIDYHCHLPTAQIAHDDRFENMTRIWLNGDHYKWRLMRANGIEERFCTGSADDWDKFDAWARTVPAIIGNPLYHWTHMELKRPFGIADRLLGPDTARSIWEACNAKLAGPRFSARGIMRQFNVRLVCTTDDPVDSLEHHKALAQDASFPIRVLPTFRPDKALAVDSPDVFNAWVASLANAADMEIGSFRDFLTAIRKRHDYFHANGCRLSDHGLETAHGAEFSEREVAAIFDQARSGPRVGPREAEVFKSAMMYEFGVMNHEKGWVQQLHLGALRNNNARQYRELGPDTGFDSIGDFEIARPLAHMLDRLDKENRLAKTIIYNLNPRDNALIASMIGNFQDGSVAGKMQFGSAWWFLDHQSGIEDQLRTISNFGLVSRFVGMLTDSRSFLSYPRHDYFRRILCNMLGGDVERGLAPNDLHLVGGIVKDICYANAARYFGFGLE
ncbi:MAG: glucuronate isomerase [Chitinivibrionales bacterium]|nr:glucuronate isomerase [Chitinivibrionales bacterium]MBD3395607.1 glucuronate isomerase [Chitinivibrionales bacterium]